MLEFNCIMFLFAEFLSFFGLSPPLTPQTTNQSKRAMTTEKRLAANKEWFLAQPPMERTSRERKRNSRYADVEIEYGVLPAAPQDKKAGRASGKRSRISKNSSINDLDTCGYHGIGDDDMALGIDMDGDVATHSIFELCKVSAQNMPSKKKGSNAAKLKAGRLNRNPEELLLASEREKERRKKRDALVHFAKIDSESDEEPVEVPKANFSGFRRPKSYPSLWAEASQKSVLPAGNMLCGMNGNIDSAQPIEKILADRNLLVTSKWPITCEIGTGSDAILEGMSDGLDVSMAFGLDNDRPKKDGDNDDDDDDDDDDSVHRYEDDERDLTPGEVAAAFVAASKVSKSSAAPYVAADAPMRVLPFPLQGAIVVLKCGKYAGYHGRVMCLNKREMSHGYHVQIIGTKVKTTVTEAGFDVIQDASKGSAGLRGFQADLSAKGTFVKIIAGEYAGCLAIILSRNKEKDLTRIRVAPFQQESENKLITNTYHRIRLKQERFRPATAAEVKKYQEGAKRREAEYKEAQRVLKEVLIRKALAGEDVPGAKIIESSIPIYSNSTSSTINNTSSNASSSSSSSSSNSSNSSSSNISSNNSGSNVSSSNISSSGSSNGAPAESASTDISQQADAPEGSALFSSSSSPSSSSSAAEVEVAAGGGDAPLVVGGEASAQTGATSAASGTAESAPAAIAPTNAAPPAPVPIHVIAQQNVRKARIYKHPNNAAALEMERLATVSILLGIGVDDASTNDGTSLNKIILANSARCATQKNKSLAPAPPQLGSLPVPVMTSPVMQSLRKDGFTHPSVSSLGRTQSPCGFVPLQTFSGEGINSSVEGDICISGTFAKITFLAISVLLRTFILKIFSPSFHLCCS